jgi:hypothetical protein
MPLSLILSPRVWGAILAAIVMTAACWKSYHYGASSVQVEFDRYRATITDQALKAEQAARAKERDMQTANQKVSQNYESLKQATATAVVALDADRMRLQDSLGGAAALSAESAARADDATRARYVVGQCAEALSKLAKSADATEDRLSGLQEYVNTVVKPSK